jgi:hypothetical protein
MSYRSYDMQGKQNECRQRGEHDSDNEKRVVHIYMIPHWYRLGKSLFISRQIFPGDFRFVLRLLGDAGDNFVGGDDGLDGLSEFGGGLIARIRDKYFRAFENRFGGAWWLWP